MKSQKDITAHGAMHTTEKSANPILYHKVPAVATETATERVASAFSLTECPSHMCP